MARARRIAAGGVGPRGNGELRIALRVLLVTPMTASSGEAVTAAEIARLVVESGGAACFLATAFTRRFIPGDVEADVLELSDDAGANRALWEAALREWRPDVVVFADYPMLFFSSGVAPIAERDEWAAMLPDVDATLVTLDHVGYAQRPQEVFFGPPHLSLGSELLPTLPAGMHVLLPCPLNAPADVPGRRGVPFRGWRVPLEIPASRRREVRRRYLEDEGVIVLYSTSGWSRGFSTAFGLPYDDVLPEVLDHYLEGLPLPVTVVTLSPGRTLAFPSGGVRFVHEGVLAPDEHEALLLSVDLLVTDNAISTTLAKALCGRVPTVVLQNGFAARDLLGRLTGRLRELALAMELKRPGSIFPYAVFPIWSREELDRLGLFRGNRVMDARVEVELWGGDTTADTLRRLLTDASTRQALRQRQDRYLSALAALPDAHRALSSLVRAARR